ncbi:MAG TPA: hypothetical protein VF771_08715, partial [Longimicrobiaceae bacterium]
ASTPLTGGVSPFELRWTDNGSAPGAGSRLYTGPLPAASRGVRAALLVRGRVVATLDERAEKFRVRGSAPPGQAREPFRHE